MSVVTASKISAPSTASSRFTVIAGAVITCATRNSAVTVDGGNLGTLETGKLADLLVVDGDPMASLDMLTAPDTGIRLLMQGGASLPATQVEVLLPPGASEHTYEPTPQQVARLGLMPGDLVTAINGTPLDDRRFGGQKPRCQKILRTRFL